MITSHYMICVCFYFFPFIRFRFTSSVNLFKALNNFLVRLFNRENVESVNRLYIPPVLCVCFFSITFNDDEKLHFALIFPFRFVCVSWRIFRVSRFGLPEESEIFQLLECFFFFLLLLFWSFEMFELSLLSVHDVQMKWRAIWNSCYWAEELQEFSVLTLIIVWSGVNDRLYRAHSERAGGEYVNIYWIQRCGQ